MRKRRALGEKVVYLYCGHATPVLTSHCLLKSIAVWPQCLHLIPTPTLRGVLYHGHNNQGIYRWILFLMKLSPKSLSEGSLFSITSAIILVYLICLTFTCINLSFRASFSPCQSILLTDLYKSQILS